MNKKKNQIFLENVVLQVEIAVCHVIWNPNIFFEMLIIIFVFFCLSEYIRIGIILDILKVQYTVFSIMGTGYNAIKNVINVGTCMDLSNEHIPEYRYVAS